MSVAWYVTVAALATGTIAVTTYVLAHELRIYRKACGDTFDLTYLSRGEQ